MGGIFQDAIYMHAGVSSQCCVPQNWRLASGSWSLVTGHWLLVCELSRFVNWSNG